MARVEGRNGMEDLRGQVYGRLLAHALIEGTRERTTDATARRPVARVEPGRE